MLETSFTPYVCLSVCVCVVTVSGAGGNLNDLTWPCLGGCAVLLDSAGEAAEKAEASASALRAISTVAPGPSTPVGPRGQSVNTRASTLPPHLQPLHPRDLRPPSCTPRLPGSLPARELLPPSPFPLRLHVPRIDPLLPQAKRSSSRSRTWPSGSAAAAHNQSRGTVTGDPHPLIPSSEFHSPHSCSLPLTLPNRPGSQSRLSPGRAGGRRV